MYIALKGKHLTCIRYAGLRAIGMEVQPKSLHPRYFHCVQGDKRRPLSLNNNYPNLPLVGLGLSKDIFTGLSVLNIESIREKHTKKQSKMLENSDDEEQVQLENDVANKDSRIMKIKVNSLRTDLLVKAGMGIARNKVEALFYESKIRVNGQRIFKKSSQLKVGDEIDVIRGRSPMNPDFILVSRIEILSASDRDDGSLNVHLQRSKSLTIEDYADPAKGTEGS